VKEVMQQLEHVRSLSFLKSELIWLAAILSSGGVGSSAGTSSSAGARFPPSGFSAHVREGQFHLEFSGLWTRRRWEIYASPSSTSSSRAPPSRV